MTWAKTANEVFSLIENSSEFGNAIVLMDIEMSLPGGKNINRKIKFINNKLPIIGLTAYTQMDEVMKEENMYFDGYISKPISERDMLTKIAECIKKCR